MSRRLVASNGFCSLCAVICSWLNGKRPALAPIRTASTIFNESRPVARKRSSGTIDGVSKNIIS